jgi:S1-C subfamily serine protease
LAATVLLLGGCAAGNRPSAVAGAYDYTGVKSVTINGRQMDAVTALNTISRNDAATLGQIPAAAHPIAGTARIVLPDHDRLRLLVKQGDRLGPGATNLVAEQQRLSLHLFADTVARSRLFTSAAITEQNDTAAPDAGGADYLIWFQVRSLRPNNAGPWVGAWLMKRPGVAAADPLGVDPGTAPGAPRLISFVHSIQLAAAGQVSAVAAGAGMRRAVSGGSGMVVDAQGHVLTNNHVVAGCPELHVADAGGESGTAVLAAADAINDLALLKTERRWPAWARFHESRGLRAGEPLVVTGFPLSGVVSPEMAVATGSLTALAGTLGDTRQLQFSAPIQPGNSGGPVLDDTGRVVGVVSSMLNSLVMAAATGALPQNVNFAIKSDTAREFLDANAVQSDEGPGRAGMSAMAVGDLARKFTVKVECWR